MKPELPEIRQAELTPEDVRDLFRDISLLCQVSSVRRRGESDRDESPISLEEAREMLQSPTSDAIQLRYSYDGTDWIDTLVSRNDTIQLTRIAIDAPDDAP